MQMPDIYLGREINTIALETKGLWMDGDPLCQYITLALTLFTKISGWEVGKEGKMNYSFIYLLFSLVVLSCRSTDFPAYSDTGYSDTPVTVTVLACPKWPFIYQK